MMTPEQIAQALEDAERRGEQRGFRLAAAALQSAQPEDWPGGEPDDVRIAIGLVKRAARIRERAAQVSPEG